MTLFLRRHSVTIVSALLGAAVGAGTSVYLYHRGRLAPPYIMSFTYSKIPVVDPAAFPQELHLFASLAQPGPLRPRGTSEAISIRSLVAVKVTVRNHGPGPIRRSDYESPLQVETIKGARVISARVAATSRADLRPGLTTPASSVVRLDPANLEAGDYFDVDLLVADDPAPSAAGPPFSLSGHVVGVTDYALRASEGKAIYSGFWLAALTILLSMVCMTALMAIAFKVGDGITYSLFRKGEAQDVAPDLGAAEVHRIARSAMASSRAVGRLMALARTHPVPQVRIAAIQGLGYLVGAHYVQVRRSAPIISLMQHVLRSDGNAEVRAAAAVALRYEGIGDENDALKEAAATDPDDRVRWIAGLGSQAAKVDCDSPGNSVLP